MMILKTGTFKTLRIIAVLLVVALGFVTLVGTSEDDAEDAASDLVEINFDENADLELDAVTAEKPAEASTQAVGDDCNTLTINQALETVEDAVDDLDKVKIENVKLRYVEGTYTAVWTPAAVGTFTCRLRIAGVQDTTIAETVINGGVGDLNNLLTEAQIDVIEYYLANRSEPFTYCLECDDAALDSYSVTFNAVIGVNIEGEI